MDKCRYCGRPLDDHLESEAEACMDALATDVELGLRMTECSSCINWLPLKGVSFGICILDRRLRDQTNQCAEYKPGNQPFKL